MKARCLRREERKAERGVEEEGREDRVRGESQLADERRVEGGRRECQKRGENGERYRSEGQVAKERKEEEGGVGRWGGGEGYVGGGGVGRKGKRDAFLFNEDAVQHCSGANNF